MDPTDANRIRVAAISFLNPAPLMWDFEHPPWNAALAKHYSIHYTRPAQCAVELHEGRADLGLIPIAALTPELAIVPGCVIASLDRVRSIQLIVRLGRGTKPRSDDGADEPEDHALAAIRTVAADTASRSSIAYAQILFRRFLGTDPSFVPAPADPIAMLAANDAAVLIGDSALLALEQREQIETTVGPCLWLDIAHQWRERTGLPWVAAVWAARPDAPAFRSVPPARLIDDLNRSRDHGLAHVEDLVAEWEPRIGLSPSTIRQYLTRNIHYQLDAECVQTIRLFRRYATEASILPPLSEPRFL